MVRQLVLLLTAALGLAARPLPPIPTYEVKRATGPIIVDGVLDEAAWRAAPVIDFIFPWDQQTGAKQNTRARLLWDDKYLYVGYQCDDADIVATRTLHDDPTYLDDAVEIFINPRPSQSSYYGMEMNARAVLYDYLFVQPYTIFKSVDLRGVLLATHIDGTLNVTGDTDRGWSLEVAIPWENFAELADNTPPKPGDVWTANLNRWDGTEPHRRLSEWADSGRDAPDPHNYLRFGKLVFVGR